MLSTLRIVAEELTADGCGYYYGHRDGDGDGEGQGDGAYNGDGHGDGYDIGNGSGGGWGDDGLCNGNNNTPEICQEETR